MDVPAWIDTRKELPPFYMVWNEYIIFFLSFRRVVNVIYSFLGNSPASEI